VIYRRRVQFYETDAQGVMHHSNYFRLFEEARGELLRSLGFPTPNLGKRAMRWSFWRQNVGLRSLSFTMKRCAWR